MSDEEKLRRLERQTRKEDEKRQRDEETRARALLALKNDPDEA